MSVDLLVHRLIMSNSFAAGKALPPVKGRAEIMALFSQLPHEWLLVDDVRNALVARRLFVSRDTVRKALNLLVKEGFLRDRPHGKPRLGAQPMAYSLRSGELPVDSMVKILKRKKLAIAMNDTLRVDDCAR